MFGLVGRGELPRVTEDEFEQLNSRLKALWLVEHNEDGTHDMDASGITSGVLERERIPTSVLSGLTNVAEYGAVGDGVTDDTLALINAIASGKSLDFGNATKTYRVTSKLTFNKSGVTYAGFGATILYDFPQSSSSVTGRLADITGSRTLFFGLIFSGNAKQVKATLLYIDDNATEPKFFNCRFTNIAGVHVNNETNGDSNMQYAIIISPYGVRNFVFHACEFDTITNRNNNVGVAQLEGLGFCGALFIGIRSDLGSPTDHQTVPTSGVISSCDFRDIYTILANGLTTNQRASYDDADGIRFYGWVWDVVAVSASSNWFEISGNYTSKFPNNQVFRTRMTTGNDGSWTVSSSSYDGGTNRTRITVTGDITSDVADGWVLGASDLPIDIVNCNFRGVSKRAIKGSVSHFVNVRDCFIDGSQRDYPMVTAIKAEYGWTIENVKMLTTADKAFDKAFQTHDVSHLRINNIYCSHVVDFFNFAPTVTTNTLSNISIENITCPYITSSGFSSSTSVKAIKSSRFCKMRLVSAPSTHGMAALSNFSTTTDYNESYIGDIEIVNGELKVIGTQSTIDDVRITLDDASYTGSSSARALVEVTGTPGITIPAAPTAADGGGAGTVTGQRWYKVAYTAGTRRSDLSAALAHTPGGANAAVVVTKPAAIGPETHWELYAAGAATGPFKLIATTVVGTTTYNDAVSGTPPVYSGNAAPQLTWNRIRNLRVDIVNCPSTYLNATRTNLIWLSGDRLEIDGIRLLVPAELSTTQPHITIYGHYIVASNIDYWGAGWVSWMYDNVFTPKFEGCVLRNFSRLGGRASTLSPIYSRHAARTILQNIFDDCTGAAAVFDITGSAAGQKYHVQNVVTNSTADPIIVGGGLTGMQNIARHGNADYLTLTNDGTKPAVISGVVSIYTETSGGTDYLRAQFPSGTTKDLATDP